MADERIDEGFFSARDGIRLFWHTERAAAPSGHVAVVHGYAEHLGRHSEVMRALAAGGYTVHLLDCRGHGQSGGKRAHIDAFDEYLSDLDLFLTRVKEQSGAAPLFLLAHSQGGLIAARYLLDHPESIPRSRVHNVPPVFGDVNVKPGVELAHQFSARGKRFIAENRDPSSVHKSGWNLLRLRVQNDRVQVWMNGKLVAAATADVFPGPGKLKAAANVAAPARRSTPRRTSPRRSTPTAPPKHKEPDMPMLRDRIGRPGLIGGGRDRRDDRQDDRGDRRDDRQDRRRLGPGLFR